MSMSPRFLLVTAIEPKLEIRGQVLGQFHDDPDGTRCQAQA